MTEQFNDAKMTELIADLKKSGYRVQERPTLVITKKDKTGYKTQMEVDISQTMYASCPNAKCGGRGRFEWAIRPSDGAIICNDCKQPVLLRYAEVADELRKKLIEETL